MTRYILALIAQNFQCKECGKNGTYWYVFVAKRKTGGVEPAKVSSRRVAPGCPRLVRQAALFVGLFFHSSSISTLCNGRNN